MDENVFVSANAIVPTDQPGGPYKESGYLVVPVKITDVIFTENYEKVVERADEKKAGMEKSVKSLQEILVSHDLNISKGDRITIEFDEICLPRARGWWIYIKTQGGVVRTEPYAVTWRSLRYERPEKR